ncbi:putative transporter MCH4 [Cyphellophora attinorum]|uniref:Putative transporter MCH4 n=1 Tax=Cyphellophora attinorum TaxID=1664694 RepID=A0A0N1P196_9EURO|nr:putative transporter MCH4 [Phialophora attinorum]KPI44807.1 putative transporter MCH4 [Phialophora attinorum]
MDPATMGALNAPPIPNVDGIEVQGDVASEEEKEADRQSSLEENMHNPIAYWASYGPPPDGGLQAWLQVLAGFSIFFNTWGLIATYGVFQSYYLTLPTLPGSSSTIAWIGSLYSFTTFFACFITGPIFDRGYLRALLLTGTFLLVFAFMMISLADRLYQFILAQGVCAGLGSGILFSTCSPILVQWWARHLGLANGIVASGAAVAGIIYPIAFHKLLPAVGFPWAVRILGFIALTTLLPANIFLKRRIPPGKPRAWLDHSLWIDWPFIAYMCAALLAVIGLYSMLFFLSSFVKQQHLLREDMSFYILPILNAGNSDGHTDGNESGVRWAGSLAGGPGGGSVLSYGGGHDWNALWVYGGLAYLAAGLCYVIVRHLHLKQMKEDKEREEREYNKEDVELEEKKQEEEQSPEGMPVTTAG